MQHCIMCGSTFSYTVWRVLLMHTCAPAISITAQLYALYTLTAKYPQSMRSHYTHATLGAGG